MSKCYWAAFIWNVMLFTLITLEFYEVLIIMLWEMHVSKIKTKKKIYVLVLSFCNQRM